MTARYAVILGLLLSAASLPALAVPPGETVELRDNPMGPATFDGRFHKEAGLECDDCHSGLFAEEIGATETSFADHHDKKSCFACHEVSYEDEGNCMDCHNL